MEEVLTYIKICAPALLNSWMVQAPPSISLVWLIFLFETHFLSWWSHGPFNKSELFGWRIGFANAQRAMASVWNYPGAFLQLPLWLRFSGLNQFWMLAPCISGSSILDKMYHFSRCGKIVVPVVHKKVLRHVRRWDDNEIGEENRQR